MKKILFALIAFALLLPAGLSAQSAGGIGGKTYALSVTSNVAGAKVFINDAEKGLTPCSIALAAGFYNLKVTAPGYQEYKVELSIKADTKHYAELVPIAVEGMAKLTVKVDSLRIVGASVTIDGAFKGTVAGSKPLTVDLPIGVHELVVELDGYSPSVTSVDLRKNSEIMVSLKPGASISFVLPAAVAKADFYLNDVLKGSGTAAKPFALTLGAGSYKLEVKAEGFRTWSGTIAMTLAGSAFTVTLKSPGSVDTVAKGTIGKPTSVKLDLKSEFARLVLKVPAKVGIASVYLGGAFKGQASSTKPLALDLAAGTYDLLVKADGFRDYAARLTIDKDMEVYADLESDSASITLKIPSTVASAQVYIDGAFKGTASPGKLFSIDLPLGVYTVLVKAEGYEDWSVKLSLDKPTELYADLKASAYTLAVYSPRSDLTFSVYVNGVLKGKTPIAMSLPAGEYLVLAKAEGYADWSTKVALSKNVDLVVAAKVASYTLSFSSNVYGAEVWIGDKLFGKAPLAIVLDAGTYSYRVKAKGYGDFVGTVVLSKDTKIDAKLAADVAIITFEVPDASLFSDEGSPFKNFRVFIDKKLVKDKDLSDIEVEAGTHTIRIVSGSLKFEATITFEAGKRYKLSLETILKLTELAGGR